MSPTRHRQPKPPSRGACTNADIMGELNLSVPTVKALMSRLFDKLEVTHRVQIAMVVHDSGLV